MFSGKWPNGGGIYVGDGVNSPDIDLNYKWNISANGVFLEVSIGENAQHFSEKEDEICYDSCTYLPSWSFHIF